MRHATSTTLPLSAGLGKVWKLSGGMAAAEALIAGGPGLTIGVCLVEAHPASGASRNLELGGQVAGNVKGTVYADTSIFLYQAPWTLLGGQYGAALAVPYVWLDVKANLLLSARRRRFAFGRQGTDNGFGDIQILPLMFGWKEGDLKWQGTFGIYAPTGNFQKGALANIGKNYWTFEPGAAASYLSSKYGFELTAFTGFDFNTENGTTNYQTGDATSTPYCFSHRRREARLYRSAGCSARQRS